MVWVYCLKLTDTGYQVFLLCDIVLYCFLQKCSILLVKQQRKPKQIQFKVYASEHITRFN